MNSSEIQRRLGENIKQIRKSKKLTQFELSEKANVSEDTIKSLEQGRTWCSDKTLSQITDALDIDVVKLFTPVGISFKKDKENTANADDEETAPEVKPDSVKPSLLLPIKKPEPPKKVEVKQERGEDTMEQFAPIPMTTAPVGE